LYRGCTNSMVSIKIYPSAKNGQEKKPAIIGMPGFVGTLEGGRIEKLFKEFAYNGVICIGMMYDGIEHQGNKVICNFNINTYIKNMQEAFEMISRMPNVDTNRIGVMASSISGAVFAYGLADNRTAGINPRSYVAISPLVAWQYYKTPEFRAGAEHAIKAGIKKDLIITSVYDAKRGIERVLPLSCLKGIEKVDGLRELESYSPNGMEVMTLVGCLDDTSSPESMRKYHEQLGGKPEDLVNFEMEGHAIDFNKMRVPVTSFLERTLGIHHSVVV